MTQLFEPLAAATDIEEWLDVEGYEGFYQISNFGRVKSLKRHWKSSHGEGYSDREKILKPKIYQGYYRVGLTKDGVETLHRVYHLVATHFIGQAPGPIGAEASMWTVDHLDFDPSNNKASNLEWVTYEENRRRANERRANDSESRSMGNKLSGNDVRTIRIRYDEGNITYQTLADEYSVSIGTISMIVNKVTWVHI